MNSNERPEFENHFAVLCAGFDVPCTTERKEAYWMGLRMMSLGMFVRTVEAVLSKDAWTKIPKPGQLWESSRRLRAEAPAKPKDDGFAGDVWTAAGNRYLLGYLVKRKPMPGTPASYASMRGKSSDASSEFTQAVEYLVAAKNAWADDMRDVAVNGEVPVATQKKWWHEHMAQAEKKIA